MTVKNIFIVILLLAVAAEGYFLVHKHQTSDQPVGTASASPAPHQRKIKYYWDSMLGPSSISDKPGKSAMGMDLEPVYEDENGDAVAASPNAAGPEVRVDSAIVQNMAVRTGIVTHGALHKTIRAIGTIDIPEPAQHDVSLKINGWIEKLYADHDGMALKAGEPLFDVYSQDLQVAEQELITARKAADAVDKNAPVTVKKEADDLLASARRKLRLWDVADSDIDAIAAADTAPRTVVFRSPVSGNVVDKAVVTGASVQAGMKLLRIEDYSTLWLNLSVYESQMEQIAPGQAVKATVVGLEDKIYDGTVTFIAPHMDHMLRTLTVRTTIDNRDGRLHPGMYASAQIITTPLPDCVLAPREAVIDTGSRQIAFVVRKAGHFEPVKVRMGLVGDDDVVQILQGLHAGDEVVTSGQFLLDVESRTIEAAEKYREGQAAGESPATAAAPATRPSQLAVIHCPMTKADWLQNPGAIANPYLGGTMLSCGTETKKVSLPADDSPLKAVVSAYVKVQQSLAGDSLDAGQLKQLKQAADALDAAQFAELRKLADQLSVAPDLESARALFKKLSTLLIGAM